ncbi:MAG: glycerate kinase family protein [Candidatus Dormibacteria bacterium]
MSRRAARVVCAPNAFKGSLSALDAAAAMALGVADAGGVSRSVPVADGGDGTLEVLLASDAASRVTRHAVAGPLGATVEARLGWLGDGTAVVEMAEASGLRLLGEGELDPLHATSRGTGELIRAALDAGAARIIVGVGGSGSTDGGAGALQALGARLLDASAQNLAAGGAALRALESIDLSALDARLRAAVVEVAVDVRTPLLGTQGAAALFAPQKGATPADVAVLEAGLARLSEVAMREGVSGDLSVQPGAGAAGGAAFGLALAGARLVPGAELVCDLVGLDAVLGDADLVLTGEGRLDAQTLLGKAPSEVAIRASSAAVRCVAVAATVVDQLPELFTGTVSLDRIAPGRDTRRGTAGLVRLATSYAVSRFGVGSAAGGTDS